MKSTKGTEAAFGRKKGRVGRDILKLDVSPLPSCALCALCSLCPNLPLTSSGKELHSRSTKGTKAAFGQGAMMAKRLRSERLAVHETAAELHEVGLIDERAMRAFEEMCLIPVEPLSPAQIEKIGSEGDSSL